MTWTFPPGLVIQQALGITISKTEGGVNMPKIYILAARLDASGGLVAATVEEDMWAWNHGKVGAMTLIQFRIMSR